MLLPRLLSLEFPHAVGSVTASTSTDTDYPSTAVIHLQIV